MPHIVPLAELDRVDLPRAGGKGANLGALTRAGLPVPPGFCVATSAYQDFVAGHGLAAVIEQALAAADPADPAALEAASAAIRAQFNARPVDPALADEILQAYAALGPDEPAVAVRSSATAEDLPDLSFAGQQDTYLNVRGGPAVLAAVVNCWGSLWTARAIGYRARQAVTDQAVALAVVVQALIPSEVSGVLFTANPLTGHRGQAVVDAVFGLGEALVSGQVEPDHYVLDLATGDLISQTVGAKALATRPRPEGGVETTAADAASTTALAAPQLRQLAELGRRVQQLYGTPQDIEWAYADGRLYLLQARAITTLFPAPRVELDPLTVWFSFGAVQGLVGPLTPLGQSGIQNVAGGALRLFGIEPQPDGPTVFEAAGERLWIDMTGLLRNPLGHRVVDGALSFVEPSVGQIVRGLLTEPRLGAGAGRLRLDSLLAVARFFLPILARAPAALLNPERARAGFDAAIDAYLGAAQVAPAADRFGRLAAAVAFVRQQVGHVFNFLLPKFIPVFGPSMGALNLLLELAGPERALALAITRGLPRNVTTEMDLALWSVAAGLRADPASAAVFQTLDAPELARRYRAGTLPAAAQAGLAAFLERYGMRGVAEIDLGQPRWREDPTPVMRTLQSYLGLDPANAPDQVFARGAQAAEAAIDRLAERVRAQPGGWLKARLVRAAARRLRALMGVRESPKFLAIRIMGRARAALLAAGAEFAAAGALDRADDVAFLRLAELEALARQEARDWRALVAERRVVFARETRRPAPRVLVSDGRAFYEGLGAAADSANVITGSPVSPGVVEGRVRVVLDPRHTSLQPGEIMVCPGTDPAWTPLFLAAGGLVMEVGGLMTHGSVVAREYGLPAVVGVHQATTRLRDGQRVRVDGTAGRIVVLE